MLNMFSSNQVKMNENILEVQEELRTTVQNLSNDFKTVSRSTSKEKESERRIESGRQFHQKRERFSGGGYINNGEGGNLKFQWLELPIFTGEDPVNWIFSVELYFEFDQLTEKEKINVAVVGLDGDILTV